MSSDVASHLWTVAPQSGVKDQLNSAFYYTTLTHIRVPHRVYIKLTTVFEHGLEAKINTRVI